MTTIVRVARRYRAPAARVFRAWIDPQIAGRWLFATATRPMTEVEIDPRVGGAFRLADRRDEYAGEYVALQSPRRLAFLLGSGAARYHRVATRSRVVIDIAPQGDACRLALSHEGVPAARAGAVKARWMGILYGLDVTLDSLQPSPTFTARDDRGATMGELPCITC